jgi:predicted cupin superfamily sugar epimerase
MSTPSSTKIEKSLTGQDVISILGLQKHPEGGYYLETFRDTLKLSTNLHHSQRDASTLIYYLLERGRRSHWHRIDVAEVWHYYAGAPLELLMSKDDGITPEKSVLGIDLRDGQRPQLVVPANIWQTAESLGDWTLVGCTVAPGFVFETFELAASDWAPKGSEEAGGLK